MYIRYNLIICLCRRAVPRADERNADSRNCCGGRETKPAEVFDAIVAARLLACLHKATI